LTADTWSERNGVLWITLYITTHPSREGWDFGWHRYWFSYNSSCR